MTLHVNLRSIDSKGAKEVVQWCRRNINKICYHVEGDIRRIYGDKIAEVYHINSFRQQIVPLPRMYDSIMIQPTNEGLRVFIDDEHITWLTGTGGEIFQIPDPLTGYVPEPGSLVDNIEEYWRTPIYGDIRENEYYVTQARDEIERYFKTKFMDWLVKEIRRG